MYLHIKFFALGLTLLLMAYLACIFITPETCRAFPASQKELAERILDPASRRGGELPTHGWLPMPLTNPYWHVSTHRPLWSCNTYTSWMLLSSAYPSIPSPAFRISCTPAIPPEFQLVRSFFISFRFSHFSTGSFNSSPHHTHPPHMRAARGQVAQGVTGAAGHSMPQTKETFLCS